MHPLQSLSCLRDPDMNHVTYSRMSEEEATAQFPIRFKNLYWRLKALAQMQVFVGLVSLALGAIADYQSFTARGIRLVGIPEICGVYFIATGLVGISGSASYRRGVMIAFMVMSIHSLILFAPAMFISGYFSVRLATENCWMFRPETLFDASSFGVVCGSLADTFIQGNPDTMIRITADTRIEVGMMAVAGIQLLVSLATAIQSCYGVCEVFGWVDPSLLNSVNKMTTTTRYHLYSNAEPVIEVPTVSRHVDVS